MSSVKIILVGLLSAPLYLAAAVIPQNSSVEIRPFAIARGDAAELPQLPSEATENTVAPTTSASTETIRYTQRMTSVIETALHQAGITVSANGDHLLNGTIKEMRFGKPRHVPDGTNMRYSISATTSIHLQISNKESGKVIFAKTLTGIGMQTFNRNDPVPVDKTIDLSIDDLIHKTVDALREKNDPADVDYQDSPGKRLVDQEKR